jgi:hypothetical protein
MDFTFIYYCGGVAILGNPPHRTRLVTASTSTNYDGCHDGFLEGLRTTWHGKDPGRMTCGGCSSRVGMFDDKLNWMCFKSVIPSSYVLRRRES